MFCFESGTSSRDVRDTRRLGRFVLPVDRLKSRTLLVPFHDPQYKDDMHTDSQSCSHLSNAVTSTYNIEPDCDGTGVLCRVWKIIERPQGAARFHSLKRLAYRELENLGED